MSGGEDGSHRRAELQCEGGCMTAAFIGPWGHMRVSHLFRVRELRSTVLLSRMKWAGEERL